MTAASWPVGGLPDGTEYRVWLRAAGLAGTTVRELLVDTLPVQAVAYQRALENLAHDALADASPSDVYQARLATLFEMTAEEVAAAMPDPWTTVAGVPTDPARWNMHVTAEVTLTEALRFLQDNDVHECCAASSWRSNRFSK